MYPVTAHCSVEIGAFRSLLIAGNRMVTADVFALTTNADTQAAIMTPRPACLSTVTEEASGSGIGDQS
jgi:hypothetical protein